MWLAWAASISVNELQQKLQNTQAIQTEAIATAIDTALTKHQTKIDQQYDRLLHTIHQLLPQQPTHSGSSPSTKNPDDSTMTTPPRQSDEKRARDTPRSGSDRSRKPRRYSPDTHDSVQRPITSFLSQPKPPDPLNRDDMSYETYTAA